jgi:hypothetical protein
VAVLLLPAVCAEVRGCSSFLFGLRVAEEARGNGVASNLMVRTPYTIGTVAAPSLCDQIAQIQALDMQAVDPLNQAMPSCYCVMWC